MGLYTGNTVAKKETLGMTPGSVQTHPKLNKKCGKNGGNSLHCDTSEFVFEIFLLRKSVAFSENPIEVQKNDSILLHFVIIDFTLCESQRVISMHV